MKKNWKLFMKFILLGYVLGIVLRPIKDSLSAYFYYPLEFIVYFISCQLYFSHLEKKGK